MGLRSQCRPRRVCDRGIDAVALMDGLGETLPLLFGGGLLKIPLQGALNRCFGRLTLHVKHAPGRPVDIVERHIAERA